MSIEVPDWRNWTLEQRLAHYSGVSNNERARWAYAALVAHEDAEDCAGSDVDGITHLIADLHHLCDAWELDFVEMLARGLSHYASETGSRPDLAPGLPNADHVPERPE